MRVPLRALVAAVPCTMLLPAAPALAQPADGAHLTARNTAPRIVAASMLDTDRDDRADRLVLAYSEPINHPADADGRYPFAVSGYQVRAVLAARRTRTLTLLLTEHAARDISARPQVRYVATRKGAVKDLKGKKEAPQLYSGARPLDLDHDGYAATDCRPTMASVHPGAVDRPDSGLVDANCDGIDGMRTGPVFVSPRGADGNAGTIGSPVKTFAHALDVAGSRPIYLAAGTYPTSVTSPVTTSVYGGYSPTGWARRTTNVSTLALTSPLPVGGSATWQLVRLSAPTVNSGRGIVAMKVANATTTLDHVTIATGTASPADGGQAAGNSVGIWATGSKLALIGGSIGAGAGGAGAAGTPGTAGTAGGDGSDGSPGECVLGLGVAPGGIGGASADLVHSGGTGGLGGTLVVPASAGTPSADLTGGGAGGSTGTTGGAGQPGTPGSAGSPGTPGNVSNGTFDVSGFVPGTSTDGTTGSAGKGGGGGGGGGAQLNTTLLGTGNGGGGGGGGGTAGTGGTAASGGGGSIAVWADGSAVSLTGTRVATTHGGNGGLGGGGGAGGTGGSGGSGASACPGRVGVGGNGGRGGAGGAGGDGGDGAGGPSVGVVAINDAAVEATKVVWQLGPAGTSAAGPSHQGARLSIGTVS